MSLILIYFSVSSYINYELYLKYEVEHPESMGKISNDQYLSEKKLVEEFIDCNRLIMTFSLITFLCISFLWYTERKRVRKNEE